MQLMKYKEQQALVEVCAVGVTSSLYLSLLKNGIIVNQVFNKIQVSFEF